MLAIVVGLFALSPSLLLVKVVGQAVLLLIVKEL